MPEPGQHELLDTGRFERDPVTSGEDERDRIGVQAPSRKQERLAGRRVQPMRVVDQHEQHPLISCRRKQRERCSAEGKAVGWTRRSKCECTPNQLLLRLGQLGQMTQQRSKHVRKTSERQLESVSTPAVSTTIVARGCSRAASSSTVLPMPGSPRIARAPPRPAAA